MSETREARTHRLLVEGRVDVRGVTPRWVSAQVDDDVRASRPVRSSGPLSDLKSQVFTGMPLLVEFRRGRWSCSCTNSPAGCAHVDAVQLVTRRWAGDHAVTTPPATSG